MVAALAVWSSLRDRLLADPRFHRWVSALPGLRGIARRQSRRLFDLVAGFTYSQVLLACVQLNLFERLSNGPLSLAQLERETGLSPDSLDILLRAAVSLELLEWRGDSRVGLGMLGAVVAGNSAITALVRHHQAVYEDLTDPVERLRHPERPTRLRHYWAYAHAAASGGEKSLDDAAVADYSDLMSASQPLVAEQVLRAYDFSAHRCLLDVGGGQGTFLTHVARAHPALDLKLFDLPAVAARAAERMAGQGLAGRVQCVGGSFFSDDLPRGADIVSLVRVAYDHPDERVMHILKSIRRALAPSGGRLLIAEPLAGTPGAAAMGDAYFGLYLLAMGKGRARSAEQLSAMTRAAGFSSVRALPTPLPLQTGLLLAEATSGAVHG